MLAGYIDANTVIAASAAVSALFAIALFFNAHHQLKHNRKVERAVVKISHPSPGIEQLDSSGQISLTVSIKNYGRTPARVTDVVIKPVVIPSGYQLPTVPDYTVQFEGPKLKAFLVTDDEFHLSRFYRITPDEMSQVKDTFSDLYMIGDVDYTDQFGQHHRGGYARQYWPMIDDKGRYKTGDEFDQRKFAQRNNLLVVAQEGYNYDRVRA